MSPHETQSQVALVRDPSPRDVAIITKTLADAGIPSALWGVSAAVHFGGGLCPMDIELVINDVDQEAAFALLKSQKALPSVPEATNTTRPRPCPTNFKQWRELAPSHRYRDRRRVRLCTPMYELPQTGDSFDDMMLPFVILYSAELVGLPPLQLPSSNGKKFPSPSAGKKGKVPMSNAPYVPLSTLSSTVSFLADLNGNGGSQSDCLIPTFPHLVESEMHVLLRHVEFLSPVWGQHMAQLSELLRSKSCKNGPDSLATLVKPSLSSFAKWLQSDLKGEADYNKLSHLRELYIHASHTG